MALAPELTLHHEELDRQHAGLLDLLEEARAAMASGSAAAVEQAVADFSDAMMTHTTREEALMEETLYPERGRHRVAHEVFLADLEQLRCELRAHGPSPLVGEWLRVRLPEWLRFHIAANDVPLGHHLARRQAPTAGRRRTDGRRPS